MRKNLIQTFEFNSGSIKKLVRIGKKNRMNFIHKTVKSRPASLIFFIFFIFRTRDFDFSECSLDLTVRLFFYVSIF